MGSINADLSRQGEAAVESKEKGKRGGFQRHYRQFEAVLSPGGLNALIHNSSTLTTLTITFLMTEPPSRKMAQPNEEFNELLIKLVSERPVIWHPKYSSLRKTKSERERMWEEIHEQLGSFTPNELKKKFKHLRDRYVKEKTGKFHRSSGSQERSEWNHFNSFKFLDGIPLRTMVDRDSYENKSNTLVINHQDTISEEDSTSHFKETSAKDGSFQEMFLREMTKLNYNLSRTPTPEKSFGMQVASLLEKIPERTRLSVQIEILSLINNAIHDYELNQEYMDPQN